MSTSSSPLNACRRAATSRVLALTPTPAMDVPMMDWGVFKIARGSSFAVWTHQLESSAEAVLCSAINMRPIGPRAGNCGLQLWLPAERGGGSGFSILSASSSLYMPA